MGADLIITTKDGKYVADVGRAHNYQNLNNELDLDYDNLENEMNRNNQYLVDKMLNFKSYMEGRCDILSEMMGVDLLEGDKIEEIFEDIVESINEVGDENIGVGKKMLVAYILDEEHLTYREDY